jgi:hypothetical protein
MVQIREFDPDYGDYFTGEVPVRPTFHRAQDTPDGPMTILDPQSIMSSPDDVPNIDALLEESGKDPASYIPNSLVQVGKVVYIKQENGSWLPKEPTESQLQGLRGYASERREGLPPDPPSYGDYFREDPNQSDQPTTPDPKVYKGQPIEGRTLSRGLLNPDYMRDSAILPNVIPIPDPTPNAPEPILKKEIEEIPKVLTEIASDLNIGDIEAPTSPPIREFDVPTSPPIREFDASSVPPIREFELEGFTARSSTPSLEGFTEQKVDPTLEAVPSHADTGKSFEDRSLESFIQRAQSPQSQETTDILAQQNILIGESEEERAMGFRKAVIDPALAGAKKVFVDPLIEGVKTLFTDPIKAFTPNTLSEGIEGVTENLEAIGPALDFIPRSIRFKLFGSATQGVTALGEDPTWQDVASNITTDIMMEIVLTGGLGALRKVALKLLRNPKLKASLSGNVTELMHKMGREGFDTADFIASKQALGKGLDRPLKEITQDFSIQRKLGLDIAESPQGLPRTGQGGTRLVQGIEESVIPPRRATDRQFLDTDTPTGFGGARKATPEAAGEYAKDIPTFDIDTRAPSKLTDLLRTQLYNQLIVSGRRMLEKMGPNGVAIARKLDGWLTDMKLTAGPYATRYRAIVDKLSDSEWQEVVQFLHTGKISKSEKIREAGIGVRQVLDELGQLYSKAGGTINMKGVDVPFPIDGRPLKDYFPLIRPPGTKPLGETKELTSTVTGKFDPESLAPSAALPRDGMRFDPTTQTFREFKKPNLKGYRTDEGVILRYIDEVVSATEGLKHFGLDNVLVASLMKGLTGVERDTANALFKTAFNKMSFRDELDVELLRYATDFQIITKLARPTTALQNFTQRFINPALEFGPTAVIRGFVKMGLDPKGARALADDVGATFRQLETEYSAAATKSGRLRQWALSNRFLGGFAKVEKGNRVLSATIGKMQQNALTRKVLSGNKLAERKLRRLGGFETKFKEDAITTVQQLREAMEQGGRQAALRTSEKTQFREGVLELPQFFSNPNEYIRALNLFKSFAVKQTKFVKDALRHSLVDFAKTGQVEALGPVFAFGTVVPGFGAAVRSSRNAIRAAFTDITFKELQAKEGLFEGIMENRAPSLVWFGQYLDMIGEMAGFGITFDMFRSANLDAADAPVKFFAGPHGGTLGSVVVGAGQVLDKEFSKAVRTAFRQSFIGPYIAAEGDIEE